MDFLSLLEILLRPCMYDYIWPYLYDLNQILSYFQGFILVYDVTNWESFQKLDKLKKDIDKNRDKKEVGQQQKFLTTPCADPEWGGGGVLTLPPL